MKTVTGVLLTIILLAGTTPAQSLDDPFAALHQEALRAALREAAAAGEDGIQGTQLGHRGQTPRPVTPGTRGLTPMPQLRPLNSSGLEKLRELKPLIGPIFAMHDVPQEFLLVGLVESGYRTNAVSPADAVGVWQFVASTARRFGLIDPTGDYRSNLIRSTHAAAEYLRFLLTHYEDWRLTLAAYNAGEERVDRAIADTGSADFSKIARRRLLPDETLTYVPAVLKRMAEARSSGLIQAAKEGLR